MAKKRGPNTRRFVLNCHASSGTETDWQFADAAKASIVTEPTAIPDRVDLRRPWWEIRNQEKTGACVGFATADGVLRWLYTKKAIIKKTDRPSPRFIWMANKETDDLTRYPTTFLEPAGTTTKSALSIAQRYGCVLEHMLPMTGRLSPLKAGVFFSIAAQFRITAYFNLRMSSSDEHDLDSWRSWIARVGPVLTRLDTDDTWHRATATNGQLKNYNKLKTRGGHAICLVGYTKTHFIVRNSWGTDWGDKGFAYASNEYANEAFTEAYGATMDSKEAQLACCEHAH